jgi:U3 small nucleolar RNA-associated protein 21
MASHSSPASLSELLDKFATSTDPSEATEYLTALSPSSTDLEIRTLAVSQMPIFVRFLTAQLRGRRAFELVNTWMAVFLACHSEVIEELDEVSAEVQGWRDAMILADMIGFNRGVLEFLRSSR